MVEYDDAGSIGKRYRRQDEIGTPMCVTYDFDSETDGCVTVRGPRHNGADTPADRRADGVYRKKAGFLNIIKGIL